ncbi:MAG TPA: sigma-E factor negative regulatory protein [Noviherbaspirillum sp.]|jgi:sigma-E factor negative regulatory protein RseA|uniref:sigma-E factor negative regulatory protein n=1 Tax=Noviherbaspirillum sp. TaxID=1926288 RepID=UPI002F93C16D
MNTNDTRREQISALADGELVDAQLDQALAALRDGAARDDWELYHRIGDALRSEEIADVELRPDFSARFAARLDAEPTIIAPTALPAKDESPAPANVRRWAVPGFAAAAAMAGVAFFTTPQLMVAINGTPSLEAGQAIVAEVQPVEGTTQLTQGAGATAAGEVVLRDARIDDYLFAHQRYSPSVFSSAHYARSATLATEPGK